MKKRGVLTFLVLAYLTTGLAPIALADAPATDDVKAEIAALKARISQLETKLATMPAASASTPAPMASNAMPSLQIPSMVQGVSLSGFVDATYNYNFNSPDSRANATRVFDAQGNEFNLNAARLLFQKMPTADSRVGFTTDLYAGHDAEIIHAAGLGNAGEPFDLKQAYVEILVPTANVIHGANDIDLKVGKFVTLLGAEVIESKDNWNTSRSLMFGYAIPFTHTGVVGSYPFMIASQNMHVSAGIVNGWDDVTDNNNGKTFLWQYGLDGIALPGDSNLTVSLTGVTGPEAANSSSNRTVTDLVVIYKTPWKPLSLMYNFDYGNEANLVSQLASGKDGDGANWIGNAGYARIDINDQWSISGRGEYFNDDDGVRVIAGTPANYWEWTGTLEYRPWKNIITRLEYRYDGSDRNVFSDKTLPTPVFKDNQSTISGEVIYLF